MSSARVKSKLALQWSIDTLSEQGKLRMWTFTLPVCLPVPVACRRWSEFSRALVKELNFQGVRVFELHELHGLHVHCVVNNFYPVARLRAIAQAHGWGRIHVQRCQRAPYYVAKYVSKGQRDGAFKGRRLWASFGAVRMVLDRVKDVVGHSGRGECFQRVEKHPWLIKHRQECGKLRGLAWSLYIRECYEELHAWVRDESPGVCRRHACGAVAYAGI